MNRYCITLMLVLSATLASYSFAQDTIAVTFPGGDIYTCAVADDYIERGTGLRNYHDLPDKTGMLFVYPKPSVTAFWMPPQMTFSLDMIFMNDQKRIVHIVENAEPCKDPEGFDCENFSPGFPVSFVLEIPSGSAEKLHLETGQVLSFVVETN